MRRVLLRPSSAVVAIVLIVACERSIDRVVGPVDSIERAVGGSQSVGGGELRAVFGPRLIVRGTGEPITESLTLQGLAPEATLRIANGDANGRSRVSSGTVFVDGQEVVHPSDFGQHVAFIVVPITLQNTSVISVRLASAPGDQLTLSVEGRLATSATVTAAGGTLYLLGHQVTLVAPAGAVGSSVQLTAEPVAAPRPEAVPGTSVEMGPTGTVFSAPVTLSIAFDPAALPVGVRPASLRMHWWNSDHWEALPGNIVDVARSVVSARTTHFTTYALLPNEVVFCPGDAGAESDLRTAITHVPDNGTVFVCDGTHAVAQVLIDKPLTLRSLNAGRATLTDAEAGGAHPQGTLLIRIDGVSVGVVRIADIGIDVTGQGIHPAGIYDKIEIDSVRFSGAVSAGVTGAQRAAVVVDATSVPSARVDVTNSDFSHLYLGVWPIRAVETNVRNSRFDRFGAGAVVYSHGNTSTTQSFGRTEGNTFTNCGPTGCVRVLTAGAVVVARNRFEAMDQSVSMGAITVSTGVSFPNASPTVIEDNVIISRRTGLLETTAAGWMFQSGISLTDPNLRTAVVRRNHVTDAYSGVTSSASVSATDNWITGGVYAIRQTAMREVTFERNDMTGLLGSFTTPLAGSSFQCNWWGSTAGPTAPPAGTQWAYTPWAAEPIAGTSVECTPTPVPPVPPLATISVAPNPFAVLPGGSQQYTATGRDANGNVVPFFPTWSVTNGGGSITSTGLFTAGTVTGVFANTVRATSGSIAGTATVAVGDLASVVVTPNPATVLVGGTQQFSASPRDANGYQMNPPITRVWSVANGGGSISATGLFTAGTTTGTFSNTVTVAYGTVTGTATVSVTAPPATIAVAPSATVMLAGTSKQFVATARDANGNVVPISPTWSVVNGGGTINQGGVFVAAGAVGTFTNTVKATVGPTYGTATVTVTSQSPTVVRVCATPGEGITAPTVADAVALVAAGGTVRICDGNHELSNLTISKPVTIEAEGPGRPMFDAGTQVRAWIVSGLATGSVNIAGLGFKGLRIAEYGSSLGATLVIERSSFEKCGTQACIYVAMPSRIVNNTFTVYLENPQYHAIGVGLNATNASTTYIIADNTIVGVGSDPLRPNVWSRYPIMDAAIAIIAGTAEVERNSITNSFLGIVAIPNAQRPAIAVTAVDNVVQSTYFPIGTVSGDGSPTTFTANWNDFLDNTFDLAGPQPGVVNLRCNWWGKSSAPTLMNAQVPPPSVYTPFATSPIAGQPHTGCDPSGAALASITITPNPDTLIAGSTQQFVATGYDGNGNVTPVTPVWSIVSGGGTIDASSGLFTAGSNPGTFANTIRATSGVVTGMASLVVAPPPLVAEVRVCATAGEGVTVPTVAEALGRIIAGGTVRICDGTHLVGNLAISRPVTLTAEGPGRPTIDAGSLTGTWWVLSTAGAVAISNLQFRGYMIAAGTGSAGTSLSLEGNDFDECFLDNACVMVSMPSRIVNNTFTARLDHHVNVAIALGSQPSGQVQYSVTDNRFGGVGHDSTQANLWARYPLGEAVEVLSGVAEVSRNRITNAFWGIVASLHESRPASTVTAFDNVVRSTYFPIGRVGEPTLPGSFTANWNDVSDFQFLETDEPTGVLNLRCNWWGQPSGPTQVNASAMGFYTPFATSPVAGQPRTDCSP